MMIVEKAPGKLFLAGEYAVTNTGQTSIIMAVNRYITVTLTPNTVDRLSFDNGDYAPLSIDLSTLKDQSLENDWSLCLRTCQIMADWLTHHDQPLHGFDVTISSDLTQGNQKLGLGSSAALVVALTRAILSAHNKSVSNDVLFKLGVLTTITTPPFHSGSMGDIASAVYGGVIHYRKFDGQWLKEQLVTQSILDLVMTKWPEMAITPLQFPSDWQLLVGWTGQPANTQDMLAVHQELARLYRQTLSTKSTPLVDKLAKAIEADDYLRVATLMQLNQEALKVYAKSMHLNYLTDRLHMLLVIAHKFGAATKISGAGGGDNGIAIVKSAEKAEKIEAAWINHDITPLQLEIAPERGMD
ncbi:phosphomevalonate kinase [Weissella ceti]|uniref:phosphomevalonate kinase n=1 Tax=Weissella ceti TaxID=759620 RepID=A0ABT3E5Q4_9LACO|nr:phosphomevalonate kinase [Weissella ceti]MCW0953749.1 phosphomevalonate kinase [Weissella ceti]QVK11418.1 phosphomevalonate kinase [Weissella ceti]